VHNSGAATCGKPAEKLQKKKRVEKVGCRLEMPENI
jgi:hypothetical protein